MICSGSFENSKDVDGNQGEDDGDLAQPMSFDTAVKESEYQ